MVPSLLHIVRDHVISDICNVECLHGLPETIGEWLFQALVADVEVTMPSARHFDRTTALSERARLVHGLNVFCEAYGPLVLSGSLDLSRQLATINEFIDCLIPLTTHVTSLDLSHCQLGQDHDLVKHFVQMRCLRRLRLRDCAVTDDFLRKITIPSRVLKKGLVTLKELDLSYNSQITDKSFLHLRCLKELDILSLSGTAVTTTSAKVFASNVGLTLVETDVFGDEPTLSSVPSNVNDGWAKGLLERLTLKPSRDRQHNRAGSKDTSPFKFFYSHRKARLRLAEKLKTSSSEFSGNPALSLVRYPRSNVTHPIVTKECDRCPRPANVVLEEETIRGYLVSRPESSFDRRNGSGCRNLLDALNRS